MLTRIYAEKKEKTHSKHEKLVRPYEFFFSSVGRFFYECKLSESCVYNV